MHKRQSKSADNSCSVLMLFILRCCNYSNNKYNVYFEAVVVNNETTDQTLKLFTGSGETIEKAVDLIQKQCARPLLFSHCGVIVVDKKMPQKNFLEVCDFCYKEEEITLSAYYVTANNPKEILSAKPLSSVSVGYDIMGILKQNSSFENRFFEIIKSNYKTSLPIITKGKEGLCFEG